MNDRLHGVNKSWPALCRTEHTAHVFIFEICLFVGVRTNDTMLHTFQWNKSENSLFGLLRYLFLTVQHMLFYDRIRFRVVVIHDNRFH